MKELQKQIEAINDYTDQKKVRELRDGLMWLDTNNPHHIPILEAARRKNLI